nr:WYL domain-containing protein [Brachybacterium muris]
MRVDRYAELVAARGVERLLNVIMTIGSRRRIDRSKLFRVIPDYADAPSESAAERMFERDKAAILELGLPLVTEADVLDENTVYYRLDTTAGDAVLDLTTAEYTVLLAASRAWDDAAAGGAARRVRSKLLSLGHDADPDLLRRAPRGSVESLPVLTPLLEAVTSGSTVSFDYRATTGALSTRTVEPWVVGVHDGHWYLHGWDRVREDARIFRASRIESFPRVGKAASQPRPARVDLAEVLGRLHTGDESAPALVEAAPYKALELRDRSDAPLDVERFETAAMPRPALRRLVLGSARWVTLLEPVEWRDEIAQVLARIAQRHEGAADLDAVLDAPARPVPRIRVASSGAEQLSRLISEASYVQSRSEVDLAELAEALGITQQQLITDLQVLFVCGDMGTGFEDLIEAEWEQGTVRVRNADPLRRALQLTDVEVTALLAGLAALEPAAGEESRLVAAARSKLLATRAAGPAEHRGEGAEHAGGGAERRPPAPAPGAAPAHRGEVVLAAVHRALAADDPSDPAGTLTIRYSAADRPGTSVRRIRPLRIETDGTRSYLRAHCELAQGERLFRLDRIVELLADDTPQQRDNGSEAGSSVDVSGTVAGEVWLRLEPPAHWIAEAFGARELRDAGTADQPASYALLVDPLRAPLVDAVLEAAGAADVLHPTSLRDTIVTVSRTSALRHRPT